MNKTQEIARLRSLVKELGDDSYTGPWLREQLPVIESEITSDLPAGTHAFTLAQARAEASRILTEAREGADAIKRLVEEQADRTRTAAQTYATQIKEDAKQALRNLINRI